MSIDRKPGVPAHRWLEEGVFQVCRKCGVRRKDAKDRDVPACTVAGIPRSGTPPPRSELKRPKLELTLSPEAHAAVLLLAQKAGTSRSAIVEALVLAAADEQKTQTAVFVFGGAIKKARRFGRFRKTRRDR